MSTLEQLCKERNLENVIIELDDEICSTDNKKTTDIKFISCGHVKQVKISSLTKSTPKCILCKQESRNKLIIGNEIKCCNCSKLFPLNKTNKYNYNFHCKDCKSTIKPENVFKVKLQDCLQIKKSYKFKDTQLTADFLINYKNTEIIVEIDEIQHLYDSSNRKNHLIKDQMAKDQNKFLLRMHKDVLYSFINNYEKILDVNYLNNQQICHLFIYKGETKEEIENSNKFYDKLYHNKVNKHKKTKKDKESSETE